MDKKGTHVAIKDDEKHVIHVLLSHGQTLSVAEVWYQMTIINVQANDYGNYICEGRNRMGHHGGKVHLYGEQQNGLSCNWYPCSLSDVLCSLILMSLGSWCSFLYCLCTF